MTTRFHAGAIHPNNPCVTRGGNGVSEKWARILCVMAMLIITDVVVGGSLLGGTVLSIDREARQLILQMPEGHASLFPAADDGVLKDIKIGDRVSIVLDSEGRITKLTKLPIDQGN